MRFIVIAAMIVGFQASAAESAKNTEIKKSDSKELALPDFSNLEKTAPTNSDGVSFSANMECKTNDGQTFKQGDTGFSGCMATKGNNK